MSLTPLQQAALERIQSEALAKKYKKLLKIREKEGLKLKGSKYLRDEIEIKGKKVPFRARNYQVQGILHLLAMKRFLLADDTGLGKTTMTLCALSMLWDKNPEEKVVILTTKSCTMQWADEFDTFTKGVNVFVAVGTRNKRRKILKKFEKAKGPAVLCIGYGSAKSDFRILQGWKGYILVADEATTFKNTKAQVSKVVSFMSSQASRFWALTATPIMNNLEEGFGIFNALMPNQVFGAKSHFLDNYCKVRKQQIKGGRFIPIITGHSAEHIRKFKEAVDPYLLRRAKFEVASELPPLTSQNLYCGMSSVQKEMYIDALNGVLQVGEEAKEITKLTQITYCQQIVNHPELIEGYEGKSAKLSLLTDLLKEDLAGKKVIVFSRFEKMVTVIMRELKRIGVKAVRITGKEKQSDRKKSQQAFQEGDAEVIVINTAAGMGVNLQAAEVFLFYDTPWSAGMYVQLLGRMIRIGSLHDSVLAYHLISENTIDERVMQVLDRKVELIEEVIGKLMKGDDDDEFEVTVEDDISEVFDLLFDDAKKVA